ncbi:MAG: FAD-dependent oxidoreductase [Herpetosiphonaceae bacterium]|nr:FAD-dependent oxidoreductase [Herpetosiphonaceae bacterium]
MQRLAVIGAGPAGLAAAQRLHASWPELEISIFEKSRGVGGRAATRSRPPFRFDHGAQYVKATTPALASAIAAETRHDITQPVWLLHADSQITPGDPAQNIEAKWTYADGLTRLGRELAAGLSIHLETGVGQLIQHGLQWELIAQDSGSLGRFDGVLLTPPAPQLRTMLAASVLPAERQAQIDAALAPASYRRCLSLALGYATPIERPWYALINADRQHPIAWLAREHAKPGRAPAGSSLLIAQMSPGWSLAHWATPVEDLSGAIQPLIDAILGETLPAPVLVDRQGWRYALPEAAADGAALHAVNDGLFWAGDYLVGQGRVHRAIESGWAAAERILARR